MVDRPHYDGGVLVTHEGVTKTAREWAKDNGLTCQRARRRFVCLGWTLEDAVTTPPRQPGSARMPGNTRLVECNGRVQSLSAWGRELGMSYVSVSKRLRRYPPEIALTRQKCDGRFVCVDGTPQTAPDNKPNFAPDELADGVSLKTANNRVRIGWSRKDAATISVSGAHRNRWGASRANVTRIRDLAALGIAI